MKYTMRHIRTEEVRTVWDVETVEEMKKIGWKQIDGDVVSEKLYHPVTHELIYSTTGETIKFSNGDKIDWSSNI